MATYDLAITFPLPEGAAAGSGLATGNKVFHYYPGITGRFFICVGGAGQPPYVFSGSNLPAGMTVNSDTGEVTWVNPQAGIYEDVVFSVLDDEASLDSVEINLECTTSGFKFIDVTNGNDTTGNGSLATPWQTLSKAVTAAQDSFVYFRAGTYTVGDTPISTLGSGTIWTDRIHLRATDPRPVCLMAYPGETVIFDMESDYTSPTVTGTGDATVFTNYTTNDGGWAPYVNVESSRAYVDGITFTRTWNKALELTPLGGYGWYVINCRFIDQGHTLPVTGTNMTADFSGVLTGSVGDCLVNNYWSNMRSGPAIFYTSLKAYVAFNRSDEDEGAVVQGIAYKGGPRQLNDYRNYWEADHHCIGGDMSAYTNADPDEPSTGEIWYSHLKQTGTGTVPPDGPDYCLQLNQQGTAGRWWAHRCTIEGVVRFLAVGTGDGPFGCTDCVIVNAGTYSMGFAEAGGSTDLGQITFETSLTPTGTDNLAGTTANNILDANGLLQGGFRTAYLGLKGHEIAEAEEPPPEVPSVGGPAFACGGIF
jgi:hypothetical protein